MRENFSDALALTVYILLEYKFCKSIKSLFLILL